MLPSAISTGTSEPSGGAPSHASTHVMPGRAQRLVLALIRGYQLLFSPMYAGSCRFVPSCSQYAAEAVSIHGALRGSVLAARRVARCHPLGGKGLDPVPPSRS
jgi:putative membrane protein insertion efficiency factor